MMIEIDKTRGVLIVCAIVAFLLLFLVWHLRHDTMNCIKCKISGMEFNESCALIGEVDGDRCALKGIQEASHVAYAECPWGLVSIYVNGSDYPWYYNWYGKVATDCWVTGIYENE